MNTEQVLKLNQVEKGEYFKPKWWAKEGERLIEITAKANGNLIVRASLTDDKVIWFSQSQWGDEDTTAAILQVIMDTQKEANAVWHTTELKRILAPLGISDTCLKDGFCRNARLYPDRLMDWHGNERPLTADAAISMARQLVLLLLKHREKANGVNVTAAIHRLEAIEAALKPLAEVTDSNRVYLAYGKAKQLYQELQTFEYAKLSNDEKLRGLYGVCEGMYWTVYNHNMSVAR